MTELPEPGPRHEVAPALLEYLDYFRSMVSRKVLELSTADRGRSVVPTGWTPEGLLTHLLFMERRWIVWGFCGEDVAEPWGDSGPDEGWRALPDRTVEQLVQELAEQGRLTRQIVTGATLTDVASPGGRFSAEAGPPPPCCYSCCTSSRSTPGMRGIWTSPAKSWRA